MTPPELQPAQPTSRAPPEPAPANDAQDQLYSCWNEIGIYGDGSCRELPTFVHCRNCPVYSNAGLRLLNRPLPPGYRREWTEHFAREKKRAAPGRTAAVLFRIGAEWLALPAQVFQEVAERRRIHSLPHRRQGVVLGLVNIRGELLLGVSLGRLLGLEKLSPRETPRTTFERLLVVNCDETRFAFPVDEVHGIHRFEPQELAEPPPTVAKSEPNYTQGILLWRGKTVGLLDPELLFPSLNRSLT